MNINKTNYEVFFVDYFDGKLSAAQVDELISFLKLNPELEEEFYSLKEVQVLPENVIFPDKELLKKKPIDQIINKNNFNEFCIASMEGDLKEPENSFFLLYLENNPDQKKEYGQFLKTRISIDNYKFQEKFILKHWGQLTREKINNDSFDFFCIAYLENDLSDMERRVFENYIFEHPEKKMVLDLFKKTKSRKEEKSIYPGKLKLKHFSVGSLLRFYAVPVSVAASIALILYFSFHNPDVPSQFAKNELKKNHIEQPDKVSKEPIGPKKDSILIQHKELKDRIVKQLETDQNNLALATLKTSEPMNLPIENSLHSILVNQISAEMPEMVLSIREKRMIEMNLALREDQNRKPQEEFLTPGQFAVNYIKKKVFGDAQLTTHDSNNEEKLNVWSVAEAGINGINKITGSNLQLKTKADKHGNVEAYAFNAGFLSISKNRVGK